MWKVAGFGWTAFRAENPTRVIVTMMLPRAILQCAFVAMLGRVVGGTDLSYALSGSLAVILTLSGAVAVMDVPLSDKWSGTFHRIRSGRLPVFVVFVLRSWPYALLGVFFMLVALLGVVAVVGAWHLGWQLVLWTPMYLLMSATVCASGLAGAALAAGRNADIIAGNLISSLILLSSGIVLSPGQLSWVEWIGTVLPVTHGLAAVRSGLDGDPWVSDALAEVAVGIGWVLLAGVIVSVQARRARISGHDDFV